MNCPNCNCELIWGSDFDYESVGVDGDTVSFIVVLMSFVM